MEYKRFNDKVYLRIDKGEEVLTELEKVCMAENITLAYVSALGATGDFTVGVFKTAEKKYYANSFKGDYEIVSLTGTVTTKDGNFYAHLHMSAGDAGGNVFGGHLNRAVISATCEMVIFITDGKLERQYSESIGLNLFKFD
ncbi:MAG: DNA-binding protein [Clostridia bacterium]|nr:DNA-binding protein [Clostridia bacterium]